MGGPQRFGDMAVDGKVLDGFPGLLQRKDIDNIESSDGDSLTKFKFDE